MSDNKILHYKQVKGFYTTLFCLYFVAICGVVIPYLMGHNILMCPIKFLFHIPCPGCGLTRALFCILKGDIPSAFYYNHSSVIIFPFIFVFLLLFIIDIIFNRAFAYNLYCKLNNFCKNKLVIILVIAYFLFSYCHSISINI